MVKPGGTGRPRLAISARLAPLPPNRSRNSALPSALPSPKVKTHLPAFTACGALLLAIGLEADGFGADTLEAGIFEAGILAAALLEGVALLEGIALLEGVALAATFATGLVGLFF